MSIINKSIFKTFLFISLTISACVPSKKFQEVKDEKSECLNRLSDLNSKNQELESENKEMKSELKKLRKEQKILKNDTSILHSEIRKEKTKNKNLEDRNDQLLKRIAKLKKGEEKENRKLLKELEQSREELQKRKDSLMALEQKLMKKRENLNEMSEELKEREKRVNELEDMLARKDSAVHNLRNRVSKALLGFKEKGLSVEQKNGKVYISMKADLLFGSGSTKVGPEGKETVIELAKAIQDEKGMEIIVEGHTDKEKVTPNARFKDNWDLSVLRATSVVRIMLNNSDIDPKMLSAAGKSKYVPVDPEDKKKNRRIEVILSPNLNKLFNIIKNE